MGIESCSMFWNADSMNHLHKILLALSFTSCLATASSASPRAAEILVGGRVLSEFKTNVGFDISKGRDVLIYQYLVAHKSGLFDCTVNERVKEIMCFEYKDAGIRSY